MSRPKTHFADSREPLRQGATIKALCGADIPNSYFVWEILPGEINLSALLSLRNCGKCREAIVTGQCLGGESYLYGVIDGRVRGEREEEAA